MPTTLESTCLSSGFVETTRFGVLDVDERALITLPEGMIGFQDCRRYVLVDTDGSNPIKWLQSVDDGSLAFPVVDPWEFKPDYAPTLADADAEALDLDESTPNRVLTVVTIPRDDPRSMSANLLGPVVINARTRIGRQVVVENESYTTRHSIVDELMHVVAQRAA